MDSKVIFLIALMFVFLFTAAPLCSDDDAADDDSSDDDAADDDSADDDDDIGDYGINAMSHVVNAEGKLIIAAINRENNLAILVVSDSNIQLIPLAMFGMFPELKTAPDGSLHLIYSGAIGKSLHYAYSNDGLNWRIEPVGESFWWSGGWSLAVDAGSRPHISGYVYEDGIQLRYYRRERDNWVYETIDTVDEVDGFAETALVVDDQNVAHIAYSNSNCHYQHTYYDIDVFMHYADNAGGVWNTQLVDYVNYWIYDHCAFGVGNHLLMFLDPAGFTHLLSIEFTADGKVVGHYDNSSSAWTHRQILLDFPFALSAAMDDENTIHFAVVNGASFDDFRFFYGRFTDGTFTLLSEVEPNLIGYEISLFLTADQTLHVLDYAAGLRHLVRNNGGWTPTQLTQATNR